MRSRTNRSAAATEVKNVASIGASLVVSVRAANGASMLDEPSIISAMRRPGRVTSRRDSGVAGSASAMAKSGTPARASTSGRCRIVGAHWRTHESSIAGSTTWPWPGRRTVTERSARATSATPARASTASSARSFSPKTSSLSRTSRHSARARSTKLEMAARTRTRYPCQAATRRGEPRPLHHRPGVAPGQATGEFAGGADRALDRALVDAGAAEACGRGRGQAVAHPLHGAIGFGGGRQVSRSDRRRDERVASAQQPLAERQLAVGDLRRPADALRRRFADGVAADQAHRRRGARHQRVGPALGLARPRHFRQLAAWRAAGSPGPRPATNAPWPARRGRRRRAPRPAPPPPRPGRRAPSRGCRGRGRGTAATRDRRRSGRWRRGCRGRRRARATARAGPGPAGRRSGHAPATWCRRSSAVSIR